MDTIGPTILLVDDTEAQRYALARGLQAAGFQVQQAADGAQALQLAQLQPDLILLDVLLPGMDGFEVCRRLKANPDTAHIPVIYVSASLVESEHRVQGLEMGADDYIVRPVSTEELIAKLRAWLRVRRAETELRARNAELHAALNALRSSEQEYRAMFHLAGVGKAQAGPDGRWLRVNRKFCEITGYSEDELLSLSFPDITHPDDQHAWHQVFARLMSGEVATHQGDTRYVRKDGSIIWVRITGTAIRDREGRPTHWAGIVEDVSERKLDEERLRRSEAILAHAGKMARLGAWDVAISDHGRLLDSALHWSDEVFRIFGYEPGEVTPSSRLFLKRVHPHDRQRVLATLNEAMARRRAYEVEHRIVRADGLERIVLQRAEISFDGRGRPRHIIGAVQDITERKRAELALREREEQLATVLAALPIAVYIADARGTLIQANPAAEQLWGAAAPLAATSQYHRFLGWSADTGEPLQAGDWALARAIRTGEVVADQEVDIETFDGLHKTILASALPIRGAGGHITGGVAINVDITHRKRMERELSEAKELVETRLAQFHVTINSMTEGVCFFDAHGEAVLVNDAFFRTYGFDPECLPENTRKMRSLLAAYDLDGNFVPHSEWPVFAALRGQVVTHCELRIRRLDTGREVILRHNAAPVRDAVGKPIMAVVTIEDVTAMKQAESALVRSEKLASVGRMAATVAHEINNPLAAVMNTLFLARTATDTPEAVHRYLELADTELKRIAHITRQALGFYRESSKPAKTSITPVLDSAVDLLKSKIKAKHVKIEREYQDTAPVLAIAGELRQVFSNLLANSLDAVDANATVRLRVSSARFGHNAQRCVRITVADNGSGIGAAALPHIFEPFFTTKESVGTGLGLWVSKQIVEKHGGSLRVHSCTNGGRRGTVFSVFLPAATAETNHATACSA